MAPTRVHAAVLVAAACGRGAAAHDPAPPGPGPQAERAGAAATAEPAEHPDAELLRTLAVLATRREPTTAELDATRRDLGAGRLTIERHIDALIAAPEFAERVAPLVILRHLLAE